MNRDKDKQAQIQQLYMTNMCKEIEIDNRWTNTLYKQRFNCYSTLYIQDCGLAGNYTTQSKNILQFKGHLNSVNHTFLRQNTDTEKWLLFPFFKKKKQYVSIAVLFYRNCTETSQSGFKCSWVWWCVDLFLSVVVLLLSSAHQRPEAEIGCPQYMCMSMCHAVVCFEYCHLFEHQVDNIFTRLTLFMMNVGEVNAGRNNKLRRGILPLEESEMWVV